MVTSNEWEEKTLGDIGSFSKGKGISKKEGNSGNIPAVRYGEIYTIHNNFIRSFHSFISPSVAANATLLRKGDLLFAASGETKEEIGKCVAFIDDKKAYAGGDIIILSPKLKVDSLFLGYLLNSSTIVSQKASKGQGDAIVHITTHSLADIRIHLPPLEEQHILAETLFDVDMLIISLERLIVKNESIKRGLMYDLIAGKQRLPGYSDDWISKPLKKMANLIQSGGTPSTDVGDYYGGGIPWVSISDITRANKWIKHTQKTISQKGLGSCSAQIFPQKTILLAMYASIGKCCIASEPVSCSQAILGISKFIDVDIEFLYYVLKNQEENLKTMSQTGTQSNLSKSILENHCILIPPSIKEQREIADILSEMDVKIDLLIAKRNKFAHLKQSIMQELLSGQTKSMGKTS